MKETDICKSIEDLLTYYVDSLQPVYSYLVAIKDKKPIQVLIEIENTFAHIAQAFHDKDTANTNIERANNHLKRLETDLYKLLLVELKRRLDVENKYSYDIIKLSKKARDVELRTIGASDSGHKNVIDSYKRAVDEALALLKLPPCF